MHRLLPASALLLSSCILSIPLEGKRCSDTEPRCVSGFTCVNDVCVSSSTLDGGNTADAGDPNGACPPPADPTASACGVGRAWYLSPTGSDTADGRSPTTARRTLSSTLGISGGDVVHLLGGVYAQPLSFTQSGTPGCPLLYTGEADGGTIVTGTITIDGADAVIRDLVFRGQDVDSALVGGARIVLYRNTFSGLQSVNRFGVDVDVLDTCIDCVVRECTFTSPGGRAPLFAGGPRFVFRGNRAQLAPGPGFHFSGEAPLVEANDFFGEYNEDDYFDFRQARGGSFQFNVVHDLRATFFDKTLVTGAALMRRNTFARLSNMGRAFVAADAGLVADNLVTGVNIGGFVDDPRSLGGYNLALPGIPLFPGHDGGAHGTNLVGSVDFRPGTLEPLGTSPAIDGADPTLPVPAGGGLRADIGAVEVGAVRFPDGRYCFPDGGT